MKKEAMPRMSSLPSDLTTDRSYNGKVAQTMEDNKQSNTGQIPGWMTSWLGEAQPYILWLSAEFAERLKSCLPEPKPFGTNPAAKMTLEANKVSLARKGNTRHTKDRKKGKKKKRENILVTEQVCLQLQASTPTKGWPHLLHSRKLENLSQSSS